eukprot:scaffold4048_cov191-Alexandrium_tamarense.AAC.3
MAEQVQAVLERMVAPLKDLRDRGIFSEVHLPCVCVHMISRISPTFHLATRYTSTGRNQSNSKPPSSIRISPPAPRHRPSIRLPPLHRARDPTGKAA